MTNEERQQATEWFKRRPVMMAGAKRMYDLAVEALEAYVPDMNGGNMISKEAVIDLLKQMRKDGDMVPWEGKNVFARIRKLPSMQLEQQEIIHCKDCYWWTKQEASLQGRCALSGTYPTGAWYCANARKRGGTDAVNN